MGHATLPLTASRALDALVAEQVMGLLSVMIDPSDGEPLYRATPGAPSWNFVPPYSTSIAAAWTVVEKLITDCRLVRVAYNGKNWMCVTTEPGSVLPVVDCDADTAPLAICLAALKAVE